MDHAIPYPGEPWRQFDKRARKALTAHLRLLRHTRDLAAPKDFGINRKTARRRSRKSEASVHFEWLILFQCCRWPLNKIWENTFPQVGERDGRAIWQGLSDKAKLLNLELRRVKHSRKADKTNQKQELAGPDFLE